MGAKGAEPKKLKIKQLALTILEDITTVSGIGLIGWGLWEYEPWIAKVVTGGILLILGVVAALRR